VLSGVWEVSVASYGGLAASCPHVHSPPPIKLSESTLLRWILAATTAAAHRDRPRHGGRVRRFECPYFGQAERFFSPRLLCPGGDVRYVCGIGRWTDVHPKRPGRRRRPRGRRSGSLLGDARGSCKNQDHLRGPRLIGYARGLGLDVRAIRGQTPTARRTPGRTEECDSADRAAYPEPRHVNSTDVGTQGA